MTLSRPQENTKINFTHIGRNTSKCSNCFLKGMWLLFFFSFSFWVSGFFKFLQRTQETWQSEASILEFKKIINVCSCSAVCSRKYIRQCRPLWNDLRNSSSWWPQSQTSEDGSVISSQWSCHQLWLKVALTLIYTKVAMSGAKLRTQLQT